MKKEELVRAAKAGDADAFTELYKEIYRDLYHFAYYMLKHVEDAKDAVSDTVMDAWASIGMLKRDEAFRSWMFSILSNKCRAKMREYANRPAELSEMLSDTLQAPECMTTPEQLQLREEFMKLSEMDRLIVGLHVFAGYKTKEVAKLLHMNANTVRSRESRALRHIGEVLKEV
ncbi:MAG: sigma-70 family RNA polymerase sigma factor [bacterium]|nr:sigma-70 family RNA polymerase sigma factor [bacterium]